MDSRQPSNPVRRRQGCSRGGEIAFGRYRHLVFTDPPYNVSYEGYTEDRLKIEGDRMTAERFQSFLRDTFRSYRSIVKAGASLYVCHSSSWQREFQNALEEAGFKIRCQIIWAKNTFAWGFGRYKFQHEPLFYCHVAEEKDPWYGGQVPINTLGREQAGGQPPPSDDETGRTDRTRYSEQ